MLLVFSDFHYDSKITELIFQKFGEVVEKYYIDWENVLIITQSAVCTECKDMEAYVLRAVMKSCVCFM